MGNKTTRKDFALFKRECRKWIERLSLGDWEVTFHHDERADRLAC